MGLNIDVDTFFYKFTLNTFNKKADYNTIFEIGRDVAKNKLLIEECSDNIDRKCSSLNNFYVGLTEIYPYFGSKSINKYNNFNDMFDCILASQCIPYINCNIPYSYI